MREEKKKRRKKSTAQKDIQAALILWYASPLCLNTLDIGAKKDSSLCIRYLKDQETTTENQHAALYTRPIDNISKLTGDDNWQ